MPAHTLLAPSKRNGIASKQRLLGSRWVMLTLALPLATAAFAQQAGVTLDSAVLTNGLCSISGTALDAGGRPACALVLASGRCLFSCGPGSLRCEGGVSNLPLGQFQLSNLALEPNGTVILQVFVQGAISASRTITSCQAAPPDPASCQSPVVIKQQMLEWVNQFRASARLCGEYGFLGPSGPVTWNEQIDAAASAHSKDMAFHNFFSHTGSDGSNAGTRMIRYGYSAGFWSENISAGWPDTASVVNDWMESPGHCKNIMNPQFKEMGGACILNPTSTYKRYWTQILASPTNR